MFIQKQKESLTESIYEQNQAVAKQLSIAIAQEMNQFGNQLSLLAKTSAITALDSVESSGFLKSFDITSLFISGEYVTLYNGFQQLISDNSMVGPVYQNKKTFSEFEKVTPVRPYKTPWYYEENSPKRMYAITVANRSGADGTLSAAFSFRRIWQKYSSYQIGKDGFVIVVTPNNKILMHPDLSFAASEKVRSTEIGLPDYARLVSNQNKHIQVQLNDEKKYLASFAFNVQNQFGIFVLQPETELNDQLAAIELAVLLIFAVVLPTIIFITILLFIRFAIPLRKLIAHINFISEGHFDAPLLKETKSNNEIGALTQAFNRFLDLIQKQIKMLSDHQKYLELQVQKRTKELEDAKNQLDIIARTDELTKLPNRRDLREKIIQEANRAVRLRREFCFIFADIDKFKHINDTYGHNCGDVVLKTVANTLRNLLRKYDFIARWGGEEFLTMLPETGLDGATVVAERMRKAVESLKIIYGDTLIPVTITIGISLFDARLGVDRSIQLADQALYKGKNNGRNQVIIWDPKDTTEEFYKAAEEEREREENRNVTLNCTCPIEKVS